MHLTITVIFFNSNGYIYIYGVVFHLCAYPAPYPEDTWSTRIRRDQALLPCMGGRRAWTLLRGAAPGQHLHVLRHELRVVR